MANKCVSVLKMRLIQKLDLMNVIMVLIKGAATHQFQLHDAHTVPEDVGGRPQQLCEGVQSVVFKGRTSDLEREQIMDQCNIKAIN